MCGISLIIDSDGTLAAPAGLAYSLAQMQKQQHHRGPDSGGTIMLPWHSGSLSLGSRRLQILDASQAADQPMQRSYGGRKGYLSYNGEVYNYTNIRNELLQLGCSFSSSADTEVVLYALLVWGKSALQQFNGMFALAYYEEQEQEEPFLLLARDRWGQKPLYYSRQQNHWIVASELQTLFAAGLVKKQLNQQQLMHYLRYKFAARPETFFEGVAELEPGHSLFLRPGQEAKKEAFIQPPSASAALADPSNDEAVLEKVEELLVDSLLLQLQSDKAVGLFLSGGVDSTLILALLRQHAAWQLPQCFTIGSGAEEASSWGTKDHSWAAKASLQYEAYHQPLALEASTVLGRFEELAGRQDQPVADGAWLLTCLLSEWASVKVKVVLNGAGADELFAGYNRHSAFASYLKNQRWLMPLLPLLKQGSRFLPAGQQVPGRQRLQLLQKFGKNVGADPYQTFLNFTSLSIFEQEVVETEGRLQGEPLQWALRHDQQQYLISDVLALNDKASMQWGLEMRMPYLDGPLTDYVSQLPASYLLKKGKKWLLKALLEKHGGKAYTRRPKEGFGMPFGGWIQEGKADFMWQWLEQKEHPLHEVLPVSLTKDLLKAHRQGKADYSQELIALALLAVWMEKNF